jgi:hypothetical protein
MLLRVRVMHLLVVSASSIMVSLVSLQGQNANSKAAGHQCMSQVIVLA